MEPLVFLPLEANESSIILAKPKSAILATLSLVIRIL
jgi:hypothetical protein